MDLIDQWPSTGWRDAFRQQATEETMEAALRCAAIELNRLDRLGAIVPWAAEDMVQGIVTATCARALSWSPGAVTLRAHLKDKIRLLGRRARRRHRTAERMGATVEVALDHLADDDPTWSDAALTTTDLAHQAIVRDLARRTEADLWRLAAKDDIALRVLRAMADGETATADIAAATGLPPLVVLNARRRLRALADHLSPDLRADARRELGFDDSNDGAA